MMYQVGVFWHFFLANLIITNNFLIFMNNAFPQGQDDWNIYLTYLCVME